MDEKIEMLGDSGGRGQGGENVDIEIIHERMTEWESIIDRQGQEDN